MARPARTRPWRGALIVALALVALWGVAGGLILPHVAKKMIAEEASERLGRPVSVERVSVNPYTLDASFEGLRILEADRTTPFVSFDRLDVEGSAASIYRWAPVIDRLTLTGLKARLVREGDNRYNVTDILQRLEAAAKARAAEAQAQGHEKDKKPARFSVSNIRLVDAAVDCDDRPVGRKHQVSEIHLSVPFVSSLPRHLKEYVQPSFAAKVNGAPVLVTGETLPFEDTLRTHFTIDINALDVRRYLAYVPVPVKTEVESGTLDAHVEVRFTQGAGKDPSIDAAGTGALRDVAVTAESGKLLRFARLEAQLKSFDPVAGRAKLDSVMLENAGGLGDDVRIKDLRAAGIDVDLKKRSARIAEVSTREGAVNVRRGGDGAIEMPRLVAVDTGGNADSPPAAPWKVAIDRATIAGYEVTLVDSAVKPAVTHKVSITSVEATDLANEDGFRGKALAKLGLGRGGSLDVDATFALEPLQVAAKVDARGLDLVPLRPYMKQFATVALKSGAASARGRVTLADGKGGLRVTYNGGAEVARFAAYDTTAREDLLSFRSVRTSGIDFAWAPQAPLALAVGEVVVDRVYSRLVVHPDGKFNVQQLRTATPDEPDAPAVAVAEPHPRNVRIDRITFVDGRLNFTDHFIKPNYSADVGEMQGSVVGLSSEPESRGKVDLKGRYDSASPVTIAGTVNPLRGDLFVDIGAKGQDIELPRLTAYAQRYAGYGIVAGKLTLDVKYHVEDGKLEGRNNITLDQLTFGDKVESPEATKLPVLFAVNLLKDADGRIALELPISGSLEDPQFGIGALMGQVIGNLLKKAVTAPFSLLAAAFGGGAKGANGGNGGGAAGAPGATQEELAFVDFAPGRTELEADDQRKLETIARALQGRPGLTLEMAPRMDPDRDLAALRHDALVRLVAADGKVPEEAAYAVAVRAAYTKAKLPGNAKELTVPAMETALMESLPVGDAELAALQRDRGEKVRAWLVEQGKLPAQRIVLAAKAEPDAAKAHAARVDFALR
ncbi:MAG TPA: DUF748 domain-containing protein [Usitatibacter sp.]|nr:DUF748 domain-containing protein [Usitatibacter sp.]